MDTTIRNLDARLYRAALARAKARGQTVGALVNEALRAFLKAQPPKARRHSFLDFKPIDFGPGTEHLSEQVDEVLYGERE